MRNDEYIKEFPLDSSDLTENEKKVLDRLVKAARLIAPIYLKQVNSHYLGANFYPHNASREEIEKAARKNRQILAADTFVVRKNGKISTISYHKKYKKELEKISDLLKEAASFSEDKEFSKSLLIQAETLLNGDYEKSEIQWLTMQPNRLSIIIGPLERYEDRLFFIKNCYTATVGVLDEEKTKYALALKDALLSPTRKVLIPSEKAEFLDKLKIRVDKTVLMSGLDGKCLFTGADYPNDPKLMEKHGAELIIFGTSLDYLFETELYPIFQKVFSKEFQRRYHKALLQEASFNYVLLHEIGHAFLRYKDAEERLKEFFPVFDELAGYVLGIRTYSALLLKDAISQKQLESLMVVFVCRCFSWWLKSKNNRTIKPFAKGHAIALNYFLECGALQEARGISWLNFTKMWVCFEELASALEHLLAFGSYEDVRYFANKFATFDTFEKFRPTIKSALKKES